MIKFGMCGCGGFIEKAVISMMKNVEYALPFAAFDLNLATLERVCEKFNIKHRCRTFNELIKIDDLDVIYVASPNVYHMEHTIAAAKARKHVFCQKPMAMNAQECRDMIKVCRDNGVKMGVGFCYRFQGAQETVKMMVEKGELGKVSYIHLSFNLVGYSPETVGWRCNPKMSGGGPLMDVAPHMFDLACYFLGDKAKSVIAYVTPEKTDTEIESDAHVLLEFSKGAHVCIDTSFVRGNLHNYTIIGEKGQMRASGTMCWNNKLEGIGKGKLILEKDCREYELDFDAHEHIEKEIRLFCDALIEGREVPVPGEAGLHSQEIIDAAYEAGQTGCKVMIKPIV